MFKLKYFPVFGVAVVIHYCLGVLVVIFFFVNNKRKHIGIGRTLHTYNVVGYVIIFSMLFFVFFLLDLKIFIIELQQ